MEQVLNAALMEKVISWLGMSEVSAMEIKVAALEMALALLCGRGPVCTAPA